MARGEGKESLASKTYGALIVSLTLSSIVAIVLNVWPDQLLTMLKTPPEVMSAAIEYTRIRSIAMPAAYLTAAAYAVLVARKDTTSPLACVCVAAAVNVLLDWIAVGVMGKGAAGAAWATTAALYAGAVAILGVLKRKGFMDAFPWGEFRWKDQIVQNLTGGVASLLKSNKVTALTGTARLHAGRQERCPTTWVS